MLRPVLLAAALVTATVAGAHAEMSPQEFIKKAITGGLFEVESSRLAMDIGPGVLRDFADRMNHDHEAANERLADIAAGEGYGVPSRLTGRYLQIMQDLRDAGADRRQDFTATYLSMQIDAHDEAIRTYETYADEGDNAELREFAANSLPLLRRHRERVEELARLVE